MLALSQIAYGQDQEEMIFEYMSKLNIGLECVPGAIFDDNFTVNQEFRKRLNKNKIRVNSMQSILYKHPELKLFEGEQTRVALFKYICSEIKASNLLGVKYFVFGAPNNRYINNMSIDKAVEIAQKFFSKLGIFAKKYNAVICIEPISTNYGCNFINSHKEAINFVNSIDNPNIKVNFDLATAKSNNEPIKMFDKKSFSYINNVHISEAGLSPVNIDCGDILNLKTVLASVNYKYGITLEMLPLKQEPEETLKTIIKKAAEIFL